MKRFCRSLRDAWIPARTLLSWRICHTLSRLGMSMIVSLIHAYEDRRDTKLILKKYPLRISAPAARLGIIDWRSSDEPFLKTPPAVSNLAMWVAIGFLAGCEIFLARTFFLQEKIHIEDLASFYVSTMLIAMILRKLLDHGLRRYQLIYYLRSMGWDELSDNKFKAKDQSDMNL